MNKLIVVFMLILAVSIGAVSADTYRITNYGGGWNPIGWVNNGYTSVSASGSEYRAAYYRDPTRMQLSGYHQDGYSVQLSGQRPVETVYKKDAYGNYRTAKYGDMRITQARTRTPYGSLSTSYNPSLGTYSGSGWIGSRTGASSYRPSMYSGGYHAGVYRTAQLGDRYYQNTYGYGTTAIRRNTVYN